jgi:TonB family protein
MTWQDDEFEAFLRQFQLRKPPALRNARSPRRLLSRNQLAAAAIIAAAIVSSVFFWQTRVRQPMNPLAHVDVKPRPMLPPKMTTTLVARSPDSSSHLLPYVEMALYASAPPPLTGPQARVDISLPGAPLRKPRTRVRPEYPPEAQQLGLEAIVDLRLRVNAAGDVISTERLSGGTSVHHDDANAAERAEFLATHSNIFWSAAEVAARAWKFEPAAGGMTCVVSFAFRLRPEMTNPITSVASPSLRPSSVGTPLPGPQLPDAPIRVGGDVKAPHAVVKVDPVYPPEAQAAHASGVVLLEITIGTDGSVSDARVLRSIPLLDQAALEAVRQWKYEPTVRNGVPVEVEMNVFINFSLSK